MKRVLTLCLVIQDGKILLGMKKRGFGMGKWNGFGGKVELGETVEEAAKRETLEECGVVIQSMEQVAINEFQFEDKMEEILEVHLFRVDTFSGEPIETDEMRPKWFVLSEIPYDTMWPDDRFWMPLFLAGKKFRAKFLFGAGEVILEKEVSEVKSLVVVG